jgi:ADP-heptose:LPS heptosyltransferase
MVAIRRYYPKAWVGLVTNKENSGNPDPEEILEGNDFLDEIITYETQRLRDPLHLYKLLKKIRSLGIDLLVYLSISKSTRKRLIRDWLFFRLGGYSKLVGFKMPKPVKTYEENGIKKMIFPQEVDRLMSLLTPLGIDVMRIEFRLPIKEKDRAAVDKIWSRYNFSGKNPIVAICPGAKFPAKRWSANCFALTSSILQKELNARIILIGGPNERKVGNEIVNSCAKQVVNLIGQTNYMESTEIIRRCDLFVGNDCGPVHLAAAVGTPVVGIYSARDFPGVWHPWGKNHTILRNDSLPCRFCFRTECETMQCINSITAGQVVEACRKYF